MGNIIQIKRVTGTLPSDAVLQPGEMAYVYTDVTDAPGALYIGSKNTADPPINIFQSNVACREKSSDIYELFDVATGDTVYPQFKTEGAVDVLSIAHGGTSGSNVYAARSNMDLIEPKFGSLTLGVIPNDVNVQTSGTAGVFEFYQYGGQSRIKITGV